jgi:phospholipase D1/2
MSGRFGLSRRASAQGRLRQKHHEPSDASSPGDAESSSGGSGRSKAWWKLALALALMVGLAAAWRFTPLHQMANADALAGWFHSLRRDPWAPVVLLLIYLGANLVFFPNTVLNAATILGLGTTWGMPCALAGSLASAMLVYYIGRRFGTRRLRRLDGQAADRLTGMLKNSSVLGIASLRLLPIAPYTAVNLVAGAARVSPVSFAFGTLLGLLPGNVLMTVFGHQLRAALRDPSRMQIGVLAALLLVALAGAWWTRKKALAA